MLLTGAEILVECLKEQGVDTVFGYPGGAVLNIYDALYKHRQEIRHIRTCHEQGAAHAADGYARATGKVGVCVATSGPGATNLVTGIATAYMDSVPMVAVTGNVSVPLLGKDSFQEVDIAGITMPITKHNFIVKDVTLLADTIRKAFYIAAEGRPGPVLIDIPKDITSNSCEYEYVKPQPVSHAVCNFRKQDKEEALKLLRNSKKPLIYAGGGIISSDASEELKAFADLIDAPVCCSLMGLGGFEGSNPRYIGMVGMHGSKTSNLSVTGCDLLIAVGARFSDRVVSKVSRFAPNAQILHIDIDPAEINKNVRAYHCLIGDLKSTLQTLNRELTQQSNPEWIKRVYQWKESFPLQYRDTGSLKAQHIIEKICELTDNDAIIATEVGQNQIWAAQCYVYNKPRTFISSGGLGTMGFGLGASIGAQVARPEKRVFNIAGDGSFRMNFNELLTAAEYNIPIIVVVLNNHALGMVRQWQKMFYDERFSQTHVGYELDYLKLAEAFGIVGLEITDASQTEDIIKQALSATRPVVIHCLIDIDDKVFPMVPPGAAIDEVIMEGEI